MFKLYENVRLRHDDKANGITSSCNGVIIDILSGGKAYVVEFFDETGETIEASLFTQYLQNQLERA